MGGPAEVTTATIYVLCDSRIDDPVRRVRYVGQTRVDLPRRLQRHWVTALAGAREHRAVWMRSVQAGGGTVVIEAITEVPFQYADNAEIEHVARMRALGCDLTNRTDGGRGKRGWNVSDETRAKMRHSAARRRASVETRQRMSAAIRSSAKHQAHLAQLHQSNRKPCPDETRRRISEALLGEGNGQNVLTWETAAQIRARFAAGERQAHLARQYGCSPATVCEVVHGRRWVSP